MQDSNPIVRFLKRPFMRSLLKVSAFIAVGWNVFVLSMVLSFFVAALVLSGLFAGMSDVTYMDDSLGDLEYVYGDNLSDNQLLIIPVRGEIVGDGGEGSFGSFANVASGYEIKQKLHDAAFHDEIKGVMLAIDSPGGTIYGGRAIADGVNFYQEKTKKPVFAHIEGLGTSGAYMAALPAKQIVADYGTEIGSIGVVMGPFKYYDTVLSEGGGLFEGGVITQNGIETVTLTAGKSKDVGNPYRRLSPEERGQLQLSINNEYDQFVQMVSQYRGIDTQTIRDKIGAMVYDPKTAQDHRLIDATASRESTFASIAKTAGIQDYQVVQEATTFGFVESLLGAVGRVPEKKVQFDTCSLTRLKLAYHGSVTDLCKQ